MSFFGSKKKNILGVDIGSGGIKIAELRSEKNRPVLHTYAYTERIVASADQNLLDDPVAAAQLVKQLMKEAKTTTNRVVAGLPIASVFSSILSVPVASGKELKEAIEWQAKKFIPLPLEEMVLDWKLLGEEKKSTSPSAKGLLKTDAVKSLFSKPEKEGPPEPTKKTMRILLTAAAKVLRDKYIAFAKAAGLELVALETEAYALIRSLVGKDLSSVMVIDFGTLQTSIVVIEKGIPVLTRSIQLGGVSVTRFIARTFGISEDQAEQMKRDIQQLSNLGIGGEAGMPALLAKVLEPLVTEIRYSLNLYRTQLGDDTRNVEKIVLTGGSAHLPYLASHLSKLLNINTYVGDPWARVGTHEDLRQTMDEIGPRFAVTIGLAMRDFE